MCEACKASPTRVYMGYIFAEIKTLCQQTPGVGKLKRVGCNLKHNRSLSRWSRFFQMEFILSFKLVIIIFSWHRFSVKEEI